jgi:hypothetical protein
VGLYLHELFSLHYLMVPFYVVGNEKLHRAALLSPKNIDPFNNITTRFKFIIGQENERLVWKEYNKCILICAGTICY